MSNIYDYRHVSKRLELEQQTSDFVVNVGGTLGRYLLNYVNRGPVVAAHTLIVAADHAVRGPQRKDHVTAVRAIVVAADAVPLRHSQSVEGHRGGPLALWDTAAAVVLPQQGQQSYDDQKEDRTARENPREQPWLRAAAAAAAVVVSRIRLSCFQARICDERQPRGKKKRSTRN